MTRRRRALAAGAGIATSATLSMLARRGKRVTAFPPGPDAITPEMARDRAAELLAATVAAATRPRDGLRARRSSTSVDPLLHGRRYFPRMLEDIKAATDHVHLLIYGYKPGEIGTTFLEALADKVREGVEVRLAVDAIGSEIDFGSKALFADLLAAGVQIVAADGIMVFREGPLGARRPGTRLENTLHFNHRKMVVIDGRVGYVGGTGIEDHYNDERFYDVMCRVTGPIVAPAPARLPRELAPRRRGRLDRARRPRPLVPARHARGPGRRGPARRRRRSSGTCPGPGITRSATRSSSRSRAPSGGSTSSIRTSATGRSSPGSWRPPSAASRSSSSCRASRRRPTRPRRSATTTSDCSTRGRRSCSTRDMAHAKVLSIDDRVFIGGCNLDDLSLFRNDEIDLLFEDPDVVDADRGAGLRRARRDVDARRDPDRVPRRAPGTPRWTASRESSRPPRCVVSSSRSSSMPSSCWRSSRCSRSSTSRSRSRSGRRSSRSSSSTPPAFWVFLVAGVAIGLVDRLVRPAHRRADRSAGPLDDGRVPRRRERDLAVGRDAVRPAARGHRGARACCGSWSRPCCSRSSRRSPTRSSGSTSRSSTTRARAGRSGGSSTRSRRPRRNRIIENVRLQQVYDTIYRYGLDIALERTPIASFRNAFQRRVLGRSLPGRRPTPEARVRIMLQQLGPTYVKLGQMAASRREALPPALVEELEKLQSDVAPFPWEQAEAILDRRARAPGRGASSRHRARAVRRRLDRPGAPGHAARRPDSWRSRSSAPGSSPRPRPTSASSRSSPRSPSSGSTSPTSSGPRRWSASSRAGVIKELDYRNEAYHAQRIAESMQKFPEIHIPVVDPTRSTARVLTAEFVNGIKISDVDRLRAAGHGHGAPRVGLHPRA